MQLYCGKNFGIGTDDGGGGGGQGEECGGGSDEGAYWFLFDHRPVEAHVLTRTLLFLIST